MSLEVIGLVIGGEGLLESPRGEFCKLCRIGDLTDSISDVA